MQKQSRTRQARTRRHSTHSRHIQGSRSHSRRCRSRHIHLHSRHIQGSRFLSAFRRRFLLFAAAAAASSRPFASCSADRVACRTVLRYCFLNLDKSHKVAISATRERAKRQQAQDKRTRCLQGREDSVTCRSCSSLSEVSSTPGKRRLKGY